MTAGNPHDNLTLYIQGRSDDCASTNRRPWMVNPKTDLDLRLDGGFDRPPPREMDAGKIQYSIPKMVEDVIELYKGEAEH